jgi:hypothetical protein
MLVSEQMSATALRFGRAPGALAVPRSRHGVAESAAGAARFAAGPRGTGGLQPLHPAPTPRPLPPAAPLRPARWLAPSPELRASYLPFGAGATRCIEEESGLAEATLILASMAARWNLAPKPTPRYPRRSAPC